MGCKEFGSGNYFREIYHKLRNTIPLGAGTEEWAKGQLEVKKSVFTFSGAAEYCEQLVKYIICIYIYIYNYLWFIGDMIIIHT